MNFIIKFRFSSFSAKYLFAIWIVFVFHACFLLETDLGKNLQHRMTASCSVNPSGCGVATKVAANIIQTLTPDIELQENGITYASNSSIDFGGILQGTSSTKTISIQNLGTANLTLTSSPAVIITGSDPTMFVITQPSSTTIPAGANITFTVTFTPTSTGTKNASISITSDDFDESNYIINLVGTSSTQLSPEINLQENNTNYASNSNFDFGVVTQGGNSIRTFTIQNLGTTTLNLTGNPIVNVTGTDATMFTITQPTATNVANGANITFIVTFNPSSIGAKTASITITNNDSDESSYIINLLGTSNAPLTPEINLQVSSVNYASNSSFDFGGIIQGTSTVRTFTIQNLGTANLNLTGTPIITVTGTDAAMFSINQPSSTTIAAAANTTFTITFNPSSTGSKTASLSIANNDSDESSYIINLLGTSNAPLTQEINLQVSSVNYASNSSFDFGDLLISPLTNPKVITFTIQNLGTANLNLTGSPIVNVTGTNAAQFTVTQPNSSTISAGGSITFTVSFTINTAGSKTATLSISNNDSDESTYRINLVGTNSMPPLVTEIDLQENNVSYAVNSNFNFGSVAQGFPSTKTFTIMNTGTATLNLTGTPIIALTGADTGMFSVSQPSVTSLNLGTNTTFTIIFNPASLGAKSATISIANSDSDESNYVINLQATGTTPEPEINIRESGISYATNSTFDFGIVNIPGSINKTFFIENTGTANLSLTNSPIILISGNDAAIFTVTQDPSSTTIPPNTAVNFIVSFTPADQGVKTAVITIFNDDSDENPYIINIQATANIVLAPEISIEENKVEYTTGSTYNFGSVAANGTNSTTKTFAILNKGNTDLNLTGTPIVVVSGNDVSMFIITQPGNATIASEGLPETFTIEFKPDNGSFGTKNATISISNNDSDENPYIINLQGNAQGL